MTDAGRPTIHVVAAFTTDAADRILMVRKRGSDIFMQPGGKPEPGETPAGALVRELAEELLIDVDPDDLASWGRYEADAANEPGHALTADVFALRLEDDVVTASAEIEEARWFTRAEAGALGERLAPLARRMLELPSVRTCFRPARFSAPLETERLRIRMMTVDDIDAVHAYQSREDVARYMPWGPRSRADVADRVKAWARADRLGAEGDYLQLAVERREDGAMLGHLFVSVRSLDSLTAVVGWTLHPDHHGRGYATEGARALFGWLFGHVGLHRIIADLDPENAASAALSRRLGMRQEAHFRQDFWDGEAWSDSAIFALLSHEFTGG